jgi:hypothetical protein
VIAVGCIYPNASNSRRKVLPVAQEGSVVGPSAAERMQLLSLKGSDEGPVKIRLKGVP